MNFNLVQTNQTQEKKEKKKGGANLQNKDKFKNKIKIECVPKLYSST
jgi:hypothetical protein